MLCVNSSEKWCRGKKLLKSIESVNYLKILQIHLPNKYTLGIEANVLSIMYVKITVNGFLVLFTIK